MHAEECVSSKDEGIVAINLYPLAADTEAMATPVFPVVGSTKMVCTGRNHLHIFTMLAMIILLIIREWSITLSGEIKPFSSASLIMLNPIL
jgi:hypothetical protein